MSHAARLIPGPIVRCCALLLLGLALGAGCAPTPVIHPRDAPAAVNAHAYAGHPPPVLDGPREPPPEAVDACRGRTERDSCSVQLGDRTLQGACETRMEDARLACWPDALPSAD